VEAWAFLGLGGVIGNGEEAIGNREEARVKG